MRYLRKAVLIAIVLALITGCGTSYKAKPLPFRVPSSYENSVEVGGATIAAYGYAKAQEAKEIFGFDIRGAGMLPVQIIFDNQGPHSLKIVPEQTFLQDEKGNLWPILEDQMAYERATRYAQTKQIFKEGAYVGFLGATAGAIIGAAVGIVAGQGVGSALGKGAALGAAAGATLGGAKGYAADQAPRAIINDLNQKSLENRPIKPNSLAFGFIFFPGEAPSAKLLRLQLMEVDTGKGYLIQFPL